MNFSREPIFVRIFIAEQYLNSIVLSRCIVSSRCICFNKARFIYKNKIDHKIDCKNDYKVNNKIDCKNDYKVDNKIDHKMNKFGIWICLENQYLWGFLLLNSIVLNRCICFNKARFTYKNKIDHKIDYKIDHNMIKFWICSEQMYLLVSDIIRLIIKLIIRLSTILSIRLIIRLIIRWSNLEFEFFSRTNICEYPYC